MLIFALNMQRMNKVKDIYSHRRNHYCQTKTSKLRLHMYTYAKHRHIMLTMINVRHPTLLHRIT